MDFVVPWLLLFSPHRLPPFVHLLEGRECTGQIQSSLHCNHEGPESERQEDRKSIDEHEVLLRVIA